MIEVETPVPGTMLTAPVSLLAYHDTQNAPVASGMTAVDAYWTMTSRLPDLYRLLFRVRDAFGSSVGIRPVGGFEGPCSREVVSGGRVDFFDVVRVSDERLVLSANDHHLDVMISINIHGEPGARRLHLTASVRTHNRVGRVYMLPVRPIHRLLVASMLRRL
ncbi:DUF2867 domain-containing protein [Phaeovibrio sulfidiphilus]|uniref:DUF2867 domain-containing protein n=1 Tax=Phaeovibrio sulfidiphilus TaxID=1220600 RepID=A0A8J6YN69_9PROT|nr:DUF2867 domain-containing protein [Phaeovibrio sulfidiphilus]MBE1237873.1 DUF2867 domain-containing protein [Phaeovibrio sulfidiphilus]